MDAAVKHAGGLDAFRRHALSRLKVKTVVRVRTPRRARPQSSAVPPRQPCANHACAPALQESHCCQIQALAANAADATCRNLFATAGRGQATVYDGAHLGDGLGVVVQYGAPPHDGKALVNPRAGPCRARPPAWTRPRRAALQCVCG